ncbi:MAG TPA: APC family permease [Candidatus Sulfomarinibacteraceae bacterium]|nr:APC family permease [Candidatus Sulfomarinibacteraceae bacterium]
MAVGGMVGGGIFAVLGVVVEIAGALAWLSFVLGGVVALATAMSYAALARRFGEGGGAFTFLRDEHHDRAAGSLSWVLIGGYVLTLSVYAFTFGHYLDAVVGLGPVFARLAAAGIVIVLAGVNLMGVGEASWLEVVTVWGKLAVLAGLAAIGLVRFSPASLRYDNADPGGLAGAVLGAAVVFMAYEGFQLLTYDYEDIRDADRVLPRAAVSAVIVVIGVYVVVSLGAASLVGAAKLVEKSEVALAAAGQSALGTTGLILVSVAAAFSTASAINATLFATSRLTRIVAADGELPRFLSATNRNGLPGRSILFLAGAAVVLAVVGDLGHLVEAASLAFLVTFTTVNVLAARGVDRTVNRVVGVAGAAGSLLAAATLAVRLADKAPGVLIGVGAVVLLSAVGRPLILRIKG